MRGPSHKSTYLVCDVVPVVLAAEVLEVLLQQGSHLDDAVGHALDLAQPLLVQLRVAKDLAGDASAVDGRVGVERAHEDLDLRVDSLLLLGAVGHHAERADSLAVQTHVLGERLRQRQTVALLDEQPHRVRVLVRVTAREPLVRHVEERVMALLLEQLADLLPLLLCRVDSSRVVGARVQEDERVFGCGLEVGDQSVKVQSDRVLVVVFVLLDFETRVEEDGLVVGPRRSGDVDGLCVRVESLEERTTYPQGTGAGDGLCDGDAVFFERLAVWSVGQDCGVFGEGGNTGDAGVLVVEVVLEELLFGSPDRRQDIRLAFVVTCNMSEIVVSDSWKSRMVSLTVCTNTQVDLLLEAVLLEGLGDTKNGIRRTFLDIGPCGRVHTGDAKDLLLAQGRPCNGTKCGEHDDDQGRSGNGGVE